MRQKTIGSRMDTDGHGEEDGIAPTLAVRELSYPCPSVFIREPI